MKLHGLLFVPFIILWASCCMMDSSPTAPPQALIKFHHPIDTSGFEPLDPQQAVCESGTNLLWYDAKALRIEGKGWEDTETFFERLPYRAKEHVSKEVKTLCTHTAGIAVRFISDAKKIYADWTVGGFDMNHMAASGIRGLDMYARLDGKWVFKGIGRPKDERTTTTIGQWFGELPGELTEFILYLPLYDRVSELKLGISKDAVIAPAPSRPYNRVKPIVFYGTSITQGGCASRTGMCHTAILGRWLDREVINLGFSGAGRMEPVMAELLAELAPSLYVLECLPNMTTEMVKERVEPFISLLREKHPSTPILLVENPINAETNSGNRELRKIFENLSERGIKSIYYLSGETQWIGQEHCTVDGVHPTDLGFYRMSLAYYPVLKKILDGEKDK